MSGTNGVMIQCFEWNSDGSGTHWQRIARNAPQLREKGFTAVWFPPASKAHAGAFEVGYGVYDLYDLGEFDQKGSVATKYGTKDELLQAVAAVQENGMDAYLDVVMNHRVGGDDPEDTIAVEVNPSNRLEVVSDPYAIRPWSRYRFPGRGGAYSDFTWTVDHFNAFGADSNQPDAQGKIFRVEGRAFSTEVSREFGNYDYLLGANHDFSRADVRDEMVRWGRWLLDTTKARGVRFDAAKHVPHSFAKEWLYRVREGRDCEVFAVGEYWSGSVDELEGYLAATEGAMRLFDVPLHFRMHEASERGRDYDIRTIFDDTLVARAPLVAVTFVDNHDSQPGQSLASPVADWFKPIAYAFILLRQRGYPCVFFGDYYGNDGAVGDHAKLVAHEVVIDAMLGARARYLHGEQHEYPASSTCVGWLATGDGEHPGVMAVVVSTADDDAIAMDTGRAGMTFRDVTRAFEEVIVAGEDGRATFPARAGRVSVWCSD